MKRLIFCLGFFSFTLLPFCFPTLLTSKSIAYSHLGKELGSLSIKSQIWLLDQELSLEKIKKQAKNRKELKQTFSKLMSITNQIKKSTGDALKKRFKYKNRNHSYLPYDENRTCKDIPGFYLSASDIYTHSQHYIVAQAPLKHTVSDFWQALLMRDSPLIITTAMPVEYNQQKAYPYWEEKAFPVYTRKWKVEHSGKDDVVIAKAKDHRLVRRTFIATNRDSGQKRTITQLHYENWPDNGVPDFDLFTKLLDCVDDMELSKHSPITVHCSAGIGRSGTFVAGHSLRKAVRKAKESGKKTISVNIPEAVMILRMQRNWMVATPSQLQTIYQLIGEEA